MRLVLYQEATLIYNLFDKIKIMCVSHATSIISLFVGQASEVFLTVTILTKLLLMCQEHDQEAFAVHHIKFLIISVRFKSLHRFSGPILIHTF